MNPTLNFQINDVGSIPVLNLYEDDLIRELVQKLISISKLDWNSFETSWDFNSLPLLSSDYRSTTFESTYNSLRTRWQND